MNNPIVPSAQADGHQLAEPCETSTLNPGSDPLSPNEGSAGNNLVARESTRSVLTATSYCVRTSQEAIAVSQAAADGHWGWHYSNDTQLGTRTHVRPGAPFRVELQLCPQERTLGLGIELLEGATKLLDCNASAIIQYVSHLLAPPQLPSEGSYCGGWVDLSDIASQVFPKPQTGKEARQQRALVWHILKYGARARVVGARTTSYFDKVTKQEIPTRLETPLWTFLCREYGEGLFSASILDDESEVPLRVELVMTRDWTRLSTDTNTAQFIMGAEQLNQFPGKKVGGAWARVMGLAYLHLCRIHTRDCLNGGLFPTRQKLLDMFPASVSPYQELFRGGHPKRVIEYFQSAEQMLAESSCGIIQLPIPRRVAQVQTWTTKTWKKVWLEEKVDWQPGPVVRDGLQDMGTKLYTQRPQDLKKLGAKRPPKSYAKRR